MRLPPDIRRRLTEIGRTTDRDINLADAALVLASTDRPGIAAEPYHRHLDRLADEVLTYVGGPEKPVQLDLRIEALGQVIIRRYGYGGTDDVFDDLDAANLMRVIDSRSGLPVVIGILFIHVARALEWDVSGLNFPGRFLVRLETDGERRIIDPFGGGAVLEPQDMRGIFKQVAGNHVELEPRHYRTMGNRDILQRLQDNIKSRQLRARHLEDALETLEAMLLFAPDKAGLWREAGMLYARLDRTEEAIDALEEYLRRGGSEDKRYNTSVLLQELRAKLN